MTGHMDKPAELPNKEKQGKHMKHASRPHTREPQKPGLMEEGELAQSLQSSTVGRMGELEKLGDRTKKSSKRIWLYLL